MTGGLSRALLAGAVAAAIVAPGANAASPVRPVDGQVLDTPRPTFVVSLGVGETLPTVEVSDSPETDDSGFVGGPLGFCIPGGGPAEFQCSLSEDLAPGTYYWLFTYQKDGDPQLHVSPPLRFVIAAPAKALDASFHASKRVAHVNEPILFDARTLLADTYAWDFGDGKSRTEDVRSVLHAFKRPGTYTVTLTVSGSAGRTASSRQTIHIIAGSAPTGPSSQATPDANAIPTVAGPSARSRKDPGYSRIASKIAGG